MIQKYINIIRYIFYLAWCRNKARFIKTKLGSFWIGLSTLLTIGSLAFVYAAVFQVENKREYITYKMPFSIPRNFISRGFLELFYTSYVMKKVYQIKSDIFLITIPSIFNLIQIIVRN